MGGNNHSRNLDHRFESRSLEHRKASMPIRLPMPESAELERRFTMVLASMDLPPDKAKVLKSYDDEKKWDLVCDQERVHAKDPPHVYLDKLRTYLDPKATRSSRKRKMLGDSTSTQVLRDLEISLRTNHIEWVREFLSEENQGLDVLVDYLSFTQVVMRREQLLSNEQMPSPDGEPDRSPRRYLRRSNAPGSTRGSNKYSSKLNMGEARNDVHVCIMCLRAIMNHQYGFNLVIAHRHAINCIALSLNHRSLRTKALVLELLAAVCLVSGGHDIILSAFDYFKEVSEEQHRFQTLMDYFQNYDEFHIDFMVACMQFVNIVVHSVENMNFRVHLQHELTKAGLDDYLEKLRHTESDRLAVQVHAYLDNMIDVAQLLEDSETKTDALEKVAELEDELSHLNEHLQEVEEEAMRKSVELEKQLSEANTDLEKMKEELAKQESEMNTLRKTVTEKDEESRKHQTMLDAKLQELEKMKSGTVTAMTIKKKIQTKHRLPILNWTPLKPQQVKGTIFAEMDDEKLYAVIDFNEFEDIFRLGPAGSLHASGLGTAEAMKKQRKEAVTLLEANRLRNVAITRRKIEMSNEEIVRAINGLDLKHLSLDMVDILQTVLPNEQEVKAFKTYERDRRPLEVLGEEDKFMIQMVKVERLAHKLTIMSFIGNYYDNIHLLQPQVNAIIAASMSLKNSHKVKKLMEIILAIGNYMNSYKRGAVYGFKLQSLDMLVDTKSGDKKTTLMHFLVLTVQDKFPDLLTFDSELRFLEKAALVSMENITTDMHELEKGMELTKKEYAARKDSRDCPVILKDFLTNAEDRFKKLVAEVKTAQDSYTRVVEHYGESARSISPANFFAQIVRFVSSFKQALLENERKRKLDAGMIQPVVEQPNKKKEKKMTQEAMVSELKNRNREIKEKRRLLKQDEVYHGALEDILLDLKNEPYRRADALRRSQRRRVENLMQAPSGAQGSSENF